MNRRLRTIVIGLLLVVIALLAYYISSPTKLQGILRFDQNEFVPGSRFRNTQKTFYLDMVFYDVNSCYVAENADGVFSSKLYDYRDKSKVVMKFKPGTLQVLDPARAQLKTYTAPNKYIKKCITSSFNETEKNKLISYTNQMSELIKDWSDNRMIIKPRFHSITANLASGTLEKIRDSRTGFADGQIAPYSEFIYYARKAGIDTSSMDFFVGVLNPFPDDDSGFLTQAPAGGTGGLFNGVPLIIMLGKDDSTKGTVWAKESFIPVLIHEMIHVINIGQYLVSGLEDVYGIQSNEEAQNYSEIKNPRPLCYANDHVENGIPNPYKYFPDSYHWLNPMWNSKPLVPYDPSDKSVISYCLQEEPDPKVNPLNPSDTYQDFTKEGFPSTMKYYKFVFQNHYQKGFAQKLYTSFCHNERYDISTPTDWYSRIPYEFSQDLGGGCLPKEYECNNDGLCLDIGVKRGEIVDLVNGLPIYNEGVKIEGNLFSGRELKFENDSKNDPRLYVSGAEFLAGGDSIDDQMTVIIEFKPLNKETTGGSSNGSLLNNQGRYGLTYFRAYTSSFTNLSMYDVISGESLESNSKELDISENAYHTIKIEKDGIDTRVYLDGKIVSTDNFYGKFIHQSSDLETSNLIIGPFNGYLKSFKVYNKILE